MTIRIIFLSVFLIIQPSYALEEPSLLRISIENEPVTLDWQNYRSVTDRLITAFLMRGLMAYDSSGKPVCDLCLSYKVNPRGTQYEFFLRPFVKWSDGVLLTAQHFVHGFHRLQSKSNHFTSAKIFSNFKSVHFKGKNKLVITLNRPSQETLDLLTLPPSYPIRKSFVTNAANDKGKNMAREAVLGPYFLAEWDPGNRIVIEGNPSYMGERPVYRVEFILGDHQSLVERFKNGKLDILRNPTTTEILGFQKAQVGMSPYWASRLLILNPNKAPLREKGLRKAIQQTLNTNKLPSYLKNGERKALSLIPPGVNGHQPDPPKNKTPEDLKKAQAIRHRIIPWNQWIDIELITQKDETEKKLSNWIVNELKSLRIRVHHKPLNSSQFYQRIESKNYQIAILTHVFQTSNPLDLIQILVDQKQLKHLRESINQSVFNERLRAALKKIRSIDFQAIALGYPSQPYLLGRRVKKFKMTPFGEPDLIRIEVQK